MPELPEVETIRRSLLPHVVGTTILEVDVRERRLRQPLDANLERLLCGRTFTGIGRRGKYLLFELDDGRTLLVHLGMSGHLAVKTAAAGTLRHDHVRIELSSGAALIFNDPRRFGLMRLGKMQELVELTNVGCDPLLENWPLETWRYMTRDRRLPIKSFLMDQRLIAGIGNIYANEMLYEAGIRPRRRASRLRLADLQRLSDAMQMVLNEAVRLGGSSISDYRDADGRPGYFQMHHAVYDRADQPCRRCSTIIRRVVLSGRSTFYCPKCQT
jgi:formamidopyrimidine-DNA glycosylase